MIQTFENFTKNLKPASELLNGNTADINSKELEEMHVKWCKQFPQLEYFEVKREYNKERSEIVWFYTYENNKQGHDLDIQIEIRKDKSWYLNFDFELKSIGNQNTNKSLNKNGLNTNKLVDNLKQVFSFLTRFDQTFNSRNNFHALAQK